MRKAAIVGAGWVPSKPRSREFSYKEMTYAAAKKAYADCGLKPSDIGAFVTCAEDLNEGTSIFDEYTPDQLGAARRPMHTVTHDGIVGLANAVMLVGTGRFEAVVVEAHSKASNILTKSDLLTYAMDPELQRPLGLNPHFIAGLEMNAFLSQTGNSEEACAAVVVKNKRQARKNPEAPYGKNLSLANVLKSPPAFTPLKDIEIAPHADGACVFVVASEEKAKSVSSKPVWISGVGWASSTSTLESRDWGHAVYAEKAARMCYKQAGVYDPAREIDLFEIDDTYSYKELQHLEACGIAPVGGSGRKVLDGMAQGGRGNGLAVNLSGGCLGRGDLLEAKGLFQVLELVLQLRGKAGRRQREKASRAFALSWRGVPTTSGAAILLSKN